MSFAKQMREFLQDCPGATSEDAREEFPEFRARIVNATYFNARKALGLPKLLKRARRTLSTKPKDLIARYVKANPLDDALTVAAKLNLPRKMLGLVQEMIDAAE